MRIFFVIIIFFYVEYVSYSFNSDSLKQFICNEKNDSVRFNRIKTLLNNEFKEGRFILFFKTANEIIEKSIEKDFKLHANYFNYVGYKCYENEKFVEAIDFFHKAAELYLAEKNSNSYAMTVALEGYLKYVVGDLDEAADMLSSNEKFCKENKLEQALDRTCMGLGFIYRDLGATEKSLDFFGRCLEISRKIDDYQYAYTALNEIGNVYAMANDYEKAISYHMQSISVKEEHKDTASLCYSYNDISLDYRGLGNYEKALQYLFKSVELSKLKKMDYLLVANYLNIADIYSRINKVNEAEEYLNIARDLADNIKVKGEQASVYAKLSEIKAIKKDYKNAYEYYVLYKNYSDSVLNEGVVNKLNELSARYEFEKSKKEIELLNKDKELKQSEIERQVSYRNSLIIGVILLVLFLLVVINRFFIKKKANVALSLKNEEITQQKEEIQSQRDEIEAQRDKLVYMNEEVTAQRDLATSQRDEIAQKSKEINDSINYAKHIQQALLSSEQIFKDLKIDYFILFKPRDIVSGDFYWFTKRNDAIIIAVADCTGHGVPGALMSMLGISFLNEIIAREEVKSPGKILDELRHYVITSLQQKDVNSIESIYTGMKDGMDISLIAIKPQIQSQKTKAQNEELTYSTFEKRCAEPVEVGVRGIDSSERIEPYESAVQNSKFSIHDSILNSKKEIMNEEERILNNEVLSFNAQWAGANNPLWIVKSKKFIKSESDKEELEDLVTELVEVKPDKMPISIHPVMNSFTNHEFELCKGDTIYLFTDGYADQFGGKDGKKFLNRKLKELILLNSQKSMMEQKEILNSSLNDWLNVNELMHEQTDDITIVGFKL